MSWSAIAYGIAVVLLANAALWVVFRWVTGKSAGPRSPLRQAPPPRVDDLAELRAEVDRLRLEIQSIKTSGVVASPYNQGLNMAQQGFGAADVAASCGLTRGEAELLVALFTKSKIKGLE